jgi:hypothetical protein
MKKYIFAALALMLATPYAFSAQNHTVPTGNAGALATADYAGVSIATVSFSSANVLLSDGGPISIRGFIVSSTTLNTSQNDFIMFRGTASLQANAQSGGTAVTDDYTTHAELFRVYLATQNLVAANTGQPLYGTTYMLPAPIRWFGGVCAKASFWNYNSIVILFERLYQATDGTPYP